MVFLAPSQVMNVSEASEKAHVNVTNIFNIPVNWTETILRSNDPGTASIHAPLNNIIGAFGMSTNQATFFAVEMISFFFGALALASAYHEKGNKGVKQFNGLRPALCLYVMARFFAWIYEAVANSQTVSRGFILFWLVPQLFQNASDAALVYNMVRTAFQPLVVAHGYKRARSVALGLSITYAALGLVQVISMGVIVGKVANINLQSIAFLASSIPPSGGAADIALGLVGFAWGWTVFGFAVHGLRRARRELPDELTVVSKYLIVASLLWIVRVVLTTMTSLLTWDYYSLPPPMFSATPLISALITDSGGLLLFSLLFYCYRPQQVPLYNGSAAANVKFKSDFKE